MQGILTVKLVKLSINPYIHFEHLPVFCCKCFLSIEFVWTQFFDSGINIEISFPMDQRFGGMLTSLDSGVSLKPAPPSPTHPNPCPFSQDGQWETYYLPCRTGNAIVLHMNSLRTLSSFIEGIILNLLYWRAN